MESLLYTDDEVAVLLKCSKRHVHNLAAAGVLKKVKLGWCSRFTLESIRRAASAEHTSEAA